MKNKMSISSILLILLISCGTKNKQTDFSDSLIDFYYPLNKEKIVYKYENVKSDTTKIGYEVIWTEFHSDTLLIREIYSSDYELHFTQKYQVTDKGAFFRGSIVHKREPNIPQDISFKILKDKIMIWDVTAPPYQIAWNDTYTDLFREREFIGYGQKIEYQGDSIATVRFKDNVWRNINGLKRDKAERFIEYAKGIGQISESWRLSDGRMTKRTLVDIIKYNDWILNKNGL
jgi:hypothetical protein